MSTEWRTIDSAPKDGTRIDLWMAESRVTDCYWGRPDHTCGEAGQYCDSHPYHDGWCDAFGYVGEIDADSPEPTHWQPLTAPPVQP